ncbi:hypothetical protein H103_01836, partial [Trichophyton rubrum CBS 288.86]
MSEPIKSMSSQTRPKPALAQAIEDTAGLHLHPHPHPHPHAHHPHARSRDRSSRGRESRSGHRGRKQGKGVPHGQRVSCRHGREQSK